MNRAMPANLVATAVAATGIWAVSAWTIVTANGSPRRELWTMTSSEKIKSHPTLVRAAVPRSLASVNEMFRLRVARAQMSAQR
jgi:hypothetical protein